MEITEQSIANHLKTIEEPRLSEILTIIDLMKKHTNKEPKMWGTIIGFGDLHYVYKTKREGNMPMIALANRKQAITIYLSYEFNEYEALKRLGKHTIGKSCLYIKKLSDINLDVLEEMIIKSIEDIKQYDFISDNDEKITSD